jgi:hypothetical protein
VSPTTGDVEGERTQMKRLALLVAVLAIVSTTISAGFNAAKEKKKSLVIGRWQMVSGEYGGQTMLTPDAVSIKMISGNHFMYLDYDKKTAKMVGVGCGSYTYDGDTYSEHIDFADRPSVPDATQLIGKDASFHLKVEGDTLTQTGQLLGQDLKEVYKRAD